MFTRFVSMNRLSDARRAAVIRSLVDGNSIRATARVTQASKNTVENLLEEVGAACLAYQQRPVSLPCKSIQCDEIWSFAGLKEKHPEPSLRGRGELADVWTWVAICEDSKLAAAFQVGKHTRHDAESFITDLAGRLSNPVQLRIDGYRLRLSAGENVQGWNGVDYSMVEKIFAYAPPSDKRQMAAPSIDAVRKPMMGETEDYHGSTTHAERPNFSMRMRIRHFTQMTNAFSRKIEKHRHAVALHFMYYNYCLPHLTLTREKEGIHTSPAMAAGLTDHVWTIEEIVALLRD